MGLLDNLFKKKNTSTRNMTQLINGFMPVFSMLQNISGSDVYTTDVQANAKHISKLSFVHYLNKKIQESSYLNYLLNLRPNPFMNAATFWEKAAYAYYTYNNLFVYIERDALGYPSALWVLDPSGITLLQDERGGYWFKFMLNNIQLTVNYEDLMHIPRNVNNSELLGKDNSAIYKVLQLIDTNYQGIEHAIKLSAFIRFIVTTTTKTSPAQEAKLAEEFSKMYLKAKEDGGVIYTSAGNTVTQVTSQPKYTNADEQKLLDTKVHRYLGVNEKILDSLYTEDEWQAYYESTLEPFITKIEQELTYKLFTTREIGFKNKIMAIADKLQHATFATRIKIITETKELGAMSVNKILELLYMEPIEGGDKRLVSLNYVNAEKQDEYQLNKSKQKNKEGDDNNDNKGQTV